MSIYSCYLVTQAAMQQFGLSKIPDEWFNWKYEYTSKITGNPCALHRIEIVGSGQSSRVQQWHTQVAEAGLVSTLICMTNEKETEFPLMAIDPWGCRMNLFVDFMLYRYNSNEIIKWPRHLSQPDELAVLGWVGHRLGGGGDRNRYFNRVKNFAHCYANELKRWIAIESNAALLAEQWGDVRGWPEPEDSPQLTVDDFAWDRLHLDTEQSKFWVPMRRLPFCEIGADLKSCDFLTNGLLPSGKEYMNWPFDFSGEVANKLCEVFDEQLANA